MRTFWTTILIATAILLGIAAVAIGTELHDSSLVSPTYVYQPPVGADVAAGQLSISAAPAYMRATGAHQEGAKLYLAGGIGTRQILVTAFGAGVATNTYTVTINGSATVFTARDGNAAGPLEWNCSTSVAKCTSNLAAAIKARKLLASAYCDGLCMAGIIYIQPAVPKARTLTHTIVGTFATVVSGTDGTVEGAGGGMTDPYTPPTGKFRVVGNLSVGTISASEQFGSGASADGGSVAVGRNSYAAGGFAVAVGDTSIASLQGVAVGAGAQAGPYGTSEGYGANASDHGVSIGDASSATSRSIAIGYAARVTHTTAVCIGDNCEGGDTGTSVGVFAYTRGTDNVALGYGASTSAGTGSVAVGANADSGGHDYAIAIGSGAVASVDNEAAIGSAAHPANVSLFGTLVSANSTSLGWTLVPVTTDTCNNVCTYACVFGQVAVTNLLVSCATSISGQCLCAGAN